MTREEAREALSVLKIYDAQWLREAIDMAIEALSEPRGDLISREDAIDAICKSCCYVTYMDCPHADDGFRCDDIEAIEALPSAENSNAKAQNSNQETQKSNGDLIYRADAIQTFIRWGQKEFGFSDLNREERFIDAINALPSADAVSEEEHVKALNDLAVAWKNKLDEESYEKGYTAGQFADRPKSEWIPVSERLPEKDELVLATVWNDVVTAWRNRYGGWESAEDMYEKGDVTAWMPLPEPYKGGDEE